MAFDHAISRDPPKQKTKVVESLCHSSDGNDIDIVELEKILKQKTYTRSQIDRLMKLLHENTCTLDASPGNAQKHLESDSLELDSSGNIKADITMKENGIVNPRLHGVGSTPVGFEEEAASPLELAKAYMISKPPIVSPSTSGSHSQFLRGPALLNSPSSPAFYRKSHIASPTPETSYDKRMPGNGFITSRSCNRSTLYRMNRTPYSRALPMDVHTGVKSTIDGYGELPPSSSHYMSEKNELSESRQVGLKRRSSVIDDDIRQGGPIRRIRQKSNLSSSKKPGLSVSGTLSINGTDAGPDVIRQAFSSRGPLLLDESEHKASKMSSSDCGNMDPCPSFISVPSQSRETAAKILQHLNLMVSSPLKGKSPELKLSADRETSPGKSATDMFCGQALRSAENVDTSKVLQCVDDSTMLHSSCSGLPDVCGTFSQNQKKVEEKLSSNFVAPSEMIALVSNCSDTPIVDSISTRTSKPDFSTTGASSSRTKQSFKMSAHEDLDDEYYTSDAAPGVMKVDNEKLDTFVKRNDLATELVRAENCSSSYESKDPTSFIINKKADLGICTDRNFNFTFSSPSVLPTTVQSSTFISHSSSAITSGLAPNKPAAAAPLFLNFSAEAVKCVGESHLSTSAASNSNPQSSSIVELQGVHGIPEMQKMGNKETRKDGNFNSQPSVAAASFVELSPTLPSSSSNASVFPSPAFSSQLLPDSTTTSSLTPPSTHTSSVSASPSFSTTSVFKIGSSATPETAVLGVEAKTVQDKLPGSNSSFGGFSGASGGSNIFGCISGSNSSASIYGYNTTSSSSTANNQSLCSSKALGSGSESMTSVQPSSIGFSSIAPTSGFGSSASSSMFGISSSSSVSNNMFGSNNAFVLNPSSHAPEPNTSGSAAPGSTTSPFGSGWKSSQSPIFGLTSPSTGFSFDAPSSRAPSMVFGSSSSSGASAPSMVFGLSSSSAASTPSMTFGLSSSASASAPSSVFGLLPSSSASAPSMVFNSSSSSAAPSMVFGSSSTASVPSMTFGSSSASAPTMVFGTSSVSSPSMVFGSSSAAAPSMVFGSSSVSSPSMASSPSMVFGSSSMFPQPVFGNRNPVFDSPNNDSMSMEDSMTEDVSTPVPVFGQTAPSSVGGIAFGGPSPFQFGGQMASPFQAGGVDMSGGGGGSFSLGSGGTPKPGRRVVKISRRKGKH